MSNQKTHFSWDDSLLEKASEKLSPGNTTVNNNLISTKKQWQKNASEMWSSLFGRKKEPEIDPSTGMPRNEAKEIDKNSNFTPLSEETRKKLTQQWDLKDGSQAEIDALRRRLHSQVSSESQKASQWFTNKTRERDNKIRKEEEEKAQKQARQNEENSQDASSGAGKQKGKLGQAKAKAKTSYKQTNDTTENKAGKMG